MEVKEQKTEGVKVIISGEKEGRLLFYSSILRLFFFLIASTCALIYLSEFDEPCCEGPVL